jgi:hypothetical protein
MVGMMAGRAYHFAWQMVAAPAVGVGTPPKIRGAILAPFRGKNLQICREFHDHFRESAKKPKINPGQMQSLVGWHMRSD